ncbi:hypothetical protein GD416_31955 [Burkholderia sp. BE24]|nr:hypothetical protein [Burkholderia sp. BE24]
MARHGGEPGELTGTGVHDRFFDCAAALVTISLRWRVGTRARHRERHESDWVSVRATRAEFAGYGGPGNLPELLALTVEWIDSDDRDA